MLSNSNFTRPTHVAKNLAAASELKTFNELVATTFQIS